MNRLAERIIQYRWMIIIVILLTTLFFAWQLPRVEIDTDIKTQLPENMPSRLDTDKIDALFGGTEMLMVLVQAPDVLNPATLNRVKLISGQIDQIQGVDQVLSLFDLKSIKNEAGVMVVEPAVNQIPQNELEREKLRQDLRANDLVYGSVVAKDFSLTAIIAFLKTEVPDEEIVPEFRKVIAEYAGEMQVMLGGLPVTRLEMAADIRNDIRNLLPLGILIMLVFLFACFRRIRGVVLPFLVVIMSIIVSVGIIPMIGWKIHMVTVILPIFLIAVANDYGIHMIAKYQEDNIPANDFSSETLAKRLFQSLSKPVILTGVTTMAGMLCLQGHILVPARQLGVLAALGIFFALLASLLFIPAVISLLPRSKPALAEVHHQKPLLERLLWHFGQVVSTRPRAIMIASFILASISAIGVLGVVVDTNPNGYYEADHPVVRINNLMDNYLGGSQNVAMVYHGNMKAPALMKKIDHMEATLGEMEEIGNTTSIARIIRQMSRALYDSTDPGFDQIPNTPEGIAQFFELYSLSSDPDDFSKMVDFPYEHAILTARVNKTSTAVLADVIARIEQKVGNDPDVLLLGGFGVVLTELARAVINGQILSLFLATVIVAILLMLLFRSFIAGLISAIPMGLSILIIFGLMGVFGIELNIATAMLSSIMIGVGIDYTIHFLWRYREERRNGLGDIDAVKKTLTTTGRGIIFNAFSVIVGFAALLFSSFLPVRFFGFLVVVSIFACLMGALVLVPAIVLVAKPAFLEN